MEEISELVELSESMRQVSALLADEDIDESKRTSTFLNVVGLGNVGAGKSAVLNTLIGHPILPTGQNGATRAPINIELNRDASLTSNSIFLHINNKSQQVSASSLLHSLQDRLSKVSSGTKKPDPIYLKLRTSTSPPFNLIDLPGLDQRIVNDKIISEYLEHNDAILLVVVPAAQAPEISSSRSLRVAKEYDSESTRTVGVITKIDQAATEPKALAAVQALLLNQGPPKTSDIPWVALIGQSVSIASAHSQSAAPDTSLETAWRAETETLKSILTGAPQTKLGRIALVDSLAAQIRNRMKLRLPTLLTGLQGKSQIVQEELVKLGGQMVSTSEGTRALGLELCREFEEKFLQHLTGGEGNGWKVVASFEGNFPNRIKQLPIDRHFDINNVKRIVLEADGYQPYLISPEKGLRSLIKGVLELAKEPSRLCVDEVHRVLVDLVSAAANATPGLGRYPPFKREIVAIASSALESFKNESKKMVVALVDMERAFVPPQHFIRLVQRRMERQRREDELKNRSSKKALDAEQSILNRATSPQTGQHSGGNLKSMKEKSGQQDKDTQEVSSLKVAGPDGEITAGYLFKKSDKGWTKRWFVLNEKSGKLGYTKKQEERHFRGTITLEECNIDEISDEDEAPAKSSKDKKSNGLDSGKASNLIFKITSKVPYKTIMKAQSTVLLKAESMVDKVEWINKLRMVAQAKGGQAIGEPSFPMRQSLSDGSLDTMARKPADPEEELRWMSQEVRGYVEAVLNSLGANVPKAVVLCQVEKAKEDMLNQLYSSISAVSSAKIEELLQEDQNVKRRRERAQKQSSLEESKMEKTWIAAMCLIMAMIRNTTATESPQYTVVHTESDFEIRLYRTSVWMSAPAVNLISFEKATRNGFHRLFQFIQGANLNFSRIPMTTPVLTTTVPGTGPLESQGYYVSFYLPTKFQENPPLPLPELNIKSYGFESHCVAVRGFSGFAKDEKVVKEAEKLDLSLSRWGGESEVKRKGGYSIAQYNGPFRIAKRRNEVWVDVHAPQLGCPDAGVAAY